MQEKIHYALRWRHVPRQEVCLSASESGAQSAGVSPVAELSETQFFPLPRCPHPEAICFTALVFSFGSATVASAPDPRLTVIAAFLSLLYLAVAAFFYQLARRDTETYLCLEQDRIRFTGTFFCSEIRFEHVRAAWTERERTARRRRESGGPVPGHLILRTRFRHHKIYLSAEETTLANTLTERLTAYGLTLKDRRH